MLMQLLFAASVGVVIVGGNGVCSASGDTVIVKVAVAGVMLLVLMLA